MFWADFDRLFDFQDCFWKKYHKNERHLCSVTHVFTKISENVCLISTYILIWWHVKCDCMLWNAFWFYWAIFIHYWRQFMSEVLHLHQTFTYCVSWKCTYFGMSNVTARFLDLMRFMQIFIYYRMFETL